MIKIYIADLMVKVGCEWGGQNPVTIKSSSYEQDMGVWLTKYQYFNPFKQKIVVSWEKRTWDLEPL